MFTILYSLLFVSSVGAFKLESELLSLNCKVLTYIELKQLGGGGGVYNDCASSQESYVQEKDALTTMTTGSRKDHC